MVIENKNPKLIKQIGPSDCAICCLSMLTGIEHAEVISRVGDTWEDGMGMANTGLALLRLGFENREIPLDKGAYRIEDVDFKILRKPWGISDEMFKSMIWGRKALLTVPSLNIDGGYHMVYWYYDELFDPSPKKTYKSYEELNIREMVLFLEKSK
mgnify:CR=1 FL=1|tara:strand:+ start:44 stop:508 length:465 start_codon:yes stop_codon:yes gene_type:complete